MLYGQFLWPSRWKIDTGDVDITDGDGCTTLERCRFRNKWAEPGFQEDCHTTMDVALDRNVVRGWSRASYPARFPRKPTLVLEPVF